MTRDAQGTSVTFLVLENPKTPSFLPNKCSSQNKPTVYRIGGNSEHEAGKYSKRGEDLTGIVPFQKSRLQYTVKESYVKQVKKAHGRDRVGKYKLVQEKKFPWPK
jgi:hypothetical protein